MLQDAQSFASIPAADLGRARAWYEEKLGLSPAMEMTGALMYQGGGGTAFLLYETEFAGTSKHTIAGWRVDDLDKEMTDLRSRGVSFEDYDMPELKTVDGVAEFEGTRSAWFMDSEGNILNLNQM